MFIGLYDVHNPFIKSRNISKVSTLVHDVRRQVVCDVITFVYGGALFTLSVHSAT